MSSLRCRRLIVPFLIGFSCLSSTAWGTGLKFSNRCSTIVLDPATSRVRLGKVASVMGWSENSILKSFGCNAPTTWTESYTAGVELGNGRRKPTTNLVDSNSNAIKNLSFTSGSLATNNSNAIVNLTAQVRVNSNAAAYGIKNNSNAIVAKCPLIMANSNAINLLKSQVRQNSNAAVYGIKNNSNAIVAKCPLIMANSNAINLLKSQVRTNSNAYAYSTKNNSNAIVCLTKLVRVNSNAAMYGIRNNSNAILAVAQMSTQLIVNNSNAIILKCRQITQNSNAIILLKQQVRTNSNAYAYSTKNNSNAIINLANLVRVNSNAAAYGIKNNSNAILSVAQMSTQLIVNNSNAIILKCRQITQNSNAILLLKSQVRQNSNAYAYSTKNNSNAIIDLGRQVKNNSNALIYGIKNNSNAIIHLGRQVKNNSNALIYGIKNNSNAIINLTNVTSTLTVNNSNAIIDLSRRVKNNSNALIYGIKNNSNTINRYATLVKQNSSAIVLLDTYVKIYPTTVSYTVDTTVCKLVYYKKGFSISAGKVLSLASPIPIEGPMDFNNTGVLAFADDVTFGTKASFTNGGHLSGNGYTLVLTGSLGIPATKTIRITSNMIIDGQGNHLVLEAGSSLIVSTGVTVTLRNMDINKLSGAQIDLEGAGTARLTLQDVTIHLDGDFNFADGRLYIQDDVRLIGSNKFIYESMYPMYINEGSAFVVDLNATFRYVPGGGASHTDRTLLRFTDDSSFMYFNGSTFESPVNGVQLTKGNLVFENKVAIKNYLADGTTPNISRTEAVTVGDGTTAGNDVNVTVLSGARVEVTGYFDYNNAV